MKKIIKKGEQITGDVVKFFLGGKQIDSKYIRAGADIIVEHVSDTVVSMEFEKDIDPVLKSAILQGGCDFNVGGDTECIIRINTMDMKADGVMYEGTMSNTPSVHFNGRKYGNAVSIS